MLQSFYITAECLTTTPGEAEEFPPPPSTLVPQCSDYPRLLQCMQMRLKFSSVSAHPSLSSLKDMPASVAASAVHNAKRPRSWKTRSKPFKAFCSASPRWAVAYLTTTSARETRTCVLEANPYVAKEGCRLRVDRLPGGRCPQCFLGTFITTPKESAMSDGYTSAEFQSVRTALLGNSSSCGRSFKCFRCRYYFAELHDPRYPRPPY